MSKEASDLASGDFGCEGGMMTQASSSSRTVLFVDDEEMIVSAAQRVLELAGFRVLTANHGDKALDLFRRHSETICCVVFDLLIPGTSGEEALRELRAIRSDVPIILATGLDVTGESEIPTTGVCSILKKPYRLEELVRLVKDVVGMEGKSGQDQDSGQEMGA